MGPGLQTGISGRHEGCLFKNESGGLTLQLRDSVFKTELIDIYQACVRSPWTVGLQRVVGVL